MSILLDEFDYYGQAANEKQLKLWVNELEDFSPNEIRNALAKIRKDESQTRPPLPAKIISEIFAYPTADEAWAMCPHDESKSVVWHEECRLAFGSVRHLIVEGDPVAARMAFRETYNAKVSEAKALKLRPKYSMSPGFDIAGRDDALKEAVEKNRLSREQALSFSETLQLPPPTRTQIASRSNLALLQAPKTEDHLDAITEEQRQKNLAQIQELLKTLQVKKDE
jgi:hypothetical protein